MRILMVLPMLTILAAATAARAERIVPSIDERFAAAVATLEKPDFRRHVVPLLGRLGCNGRA